MNTAAFASSDLLLHNIPSSLQERAVCVAKRAGLSLADVVRMTLTRLVDDDCLPFDPFDRYGDEVPNEETLEAIRELDDESLPVYDSYDEALAAIDMTDPVGQP